LNSLLWLLAFVVVTIPVAARIRKSKLQIVYMWPWNWLVRKINELSYAHDWRRYGDVALTLVVGPVLAWKIIKHRRASLIAFFVYVVLLFVLFPTIGGSSFISASLLNLAFVTLFGFGGYALALIGMTAYSIILGYLTGVHPEPGIAPALPGISIGGFSIPLVEGIVALVIALLFHEGAHGVVSVREKVPVRHGGLITLGLLPFGAYVEPDETIFRRASPLSRLRVYSAGPVANMVIFAVFAAILVAASPLASYLQDYECAHSVGVRILEVPESLSVGDEFIRSPSYGVLEAGDVILELNGEDVNCVYRFMEVLAPYRESESNATIPITVDRDGNVFTVNITLNRGYIGIKGVENVYPEPLPLWYHVLSFILSLIRWIAFLNFMIGLVNMLPLPPLDGGFIYRDLFNELGLKRVYGVVLWLTVGIIIINILPWFI